MDRITTKIVGDVEVEVGFKERGDTQTRGITITKDTIRTSIMNITTRVNTMAIGGSTAMTRGDIGATATGEVTAVMARGMTGQILDNKVDTTKLAEEVKVNQIKRVLRIHLEGLPGKKARNV